MSIGQIIDRFLKEYNNAIKWDYVHKPKAYALYQTWKWVDAEEKPRQREE